MEDAFYSFMKDKISHFLKDFAFVVAGSILFSCSINMFLLPGGVVNGGVSGIATALNLRFGVHIGLVMLLVNIPLVAANAFVYGPRFIARSVLGVVLTSLFTDTLVYFPVTVTDPFLCSVIGGVLMGCACGIIFSHGYNTGGTDLIVFLIRKRFKRISAGRIVLIADGIIIIASAFLLQNYLGVFYSALCVYVQSVVLDTVISGAERAKLVLVITERTKEVGASLSSLGRGVTVLHGYGYHTEKSKGVLLCALRKHELYRAKKAISTVDPAAFTILLDSSQIIGQGFEEKL